MTTPQTVVCRLCLGQNRPQELSRDADGHLTDVCLVCRQKELQAVLAQVAAILGPETVIDQSTIDPNSEITQEITVGTISKAVEVLLCGHRTTCWCSNCHYCEDV